MTETIQATAAKLADLCAAKAAAYGDSVGRAAKMLALQHPDGLRPDQYYDALIDARIFEKQLRRAQQSDAGIPDPHGEDPREDRAGYALIALNRATTKEHSNTWPGAANSTPAPAASPAKVTPDSARPNANSSITTSESDSSEKTNLPSPSASSESTSASDSISTESAPAPVVMEPASESADDRVSIEAIRVESSNRVLITAAFRRNQGGRCAWCTRVLLPTSFRRAVAVKAELLLVCAELSNCQIQLAEALKR